MADECDSILQTSYTLPSNSPVVFSNRLLNAAGCWSTSHEELSSLMESASGGVVTKSCTSLSRGGTGVRQHVPSAEMSINANGLRNLGMTAYAAFGESRPRSKPYIMSVSGLQNMNILRTIQSSYWHCTDAIELNLSCPNVAGSTQIGYGFGRMREVLRQACAARSDGHDSSMPNNVRTIPIGLKLPPYFAQSCFKDLAEVLDDYASEIAFVTCINSIGGGLIHNTGGPPFSSVLDVNDGIGGVGGRSVKPFGLANVRAVHQEMPWLPIFGCGGVSTAQDAEEYLAVGASMVQVGTALAYEGPSVFDRLLA